MIMNNMTGSSFERRLVEVIQDLSTQKGLKQKPLAMAAWPDRKDAGTKWRKIRNGTEPRGLRVCDAYALAEAMGVSFVELCGLAQARLMEHLKFIPIAGCVVSQRVGKPPKFDDPLCPKCKKTLFIKDDTYSCPVCGYTTNRQHTDDAIKRNKAHMGLS